MWEKSSCSLLWLPLYKEGPVLSHSPPLQLGQGLSGSGLHAAPLSTPQPVPVVSLGFPLHPYSPPCDFRQPGLSHCCSGLVWQGRGPFTWLSPRSPVAGPAQAWGCSRPGPHTGPRDLFVLNQSPYLLFSQCPLYFLFSYLHKCWAAFGYWLCFSVEWVNSTPTYLAAIFSVRYTIFE